MGKRDVTEMDWWQETHWGERHHPGLSSHAALVKAVRQGPSETLWASYMLITPKSPFTWEGTRDTLSDTRNPAKRYPKIDYALLPPPPITRRWFMHYNHMNVDEAIEAFNDLNAPRT